MSETPKICANCKHWKKRPATYQNRHCNHSGPFGGNLPESKHYFCRFALQPQGMERLRK